MRPRSTFAITVQNAAEPRHDARIVHALLPLVLEHVQRSQFEPPQGVLIDARPTPHAALVR